MNILFEKQPLRVNSIFCVGRNYGEHITELQNSRPAEPLIFIKPSQALHSGESIQLPPFSRDVHHEVEWLLLIGQDCDELQPENALEVVAGYGVGLDLTARDVQQDLKRQGLPWLKAKGFRQSACVSEFLARKRFPERLEFSLRVNGVERQRGCSEDMIFPASTLLPHLAQHYGLRAGDVIFTGTPAGVAALRSGDVLDLNLQDVIRKRFRVL